MREKGFIMSLIFISLSFSGFLFGYYLIEREASRRPIPREDLKGLIGFAPMSGKAHVTKSPVNSPLVTPKITPVPTAKPEPKEFYINKKSEIASIMIWDKVSLSYKKILETRFANPILERKDENTFYLKTIKNDEAITFLLTLDGNLTQVK